MKYMSTWKVLPGNHAVAVDRFLTTHAAPPKSVTILGRWHSAAGNGWTLSETDDPAALYESSALWTDLMEIHITPVVEDAVAGPILARVYKK
jgi:Protein of unknown function (DUF3303)